MSRSIKRDVPWGDAERARFHAARIVAGHDMAECAEILRSEFGVANAQQPNVSRWESGRIQRPRCVGALLAYADAYTQSDVPGARSDLDDFAGLAAQLAGEPLLGPAQQALVSGMTRRLANGPPLSTQDRLTYLDQLRILRVSIPGQR